MKAERKQQILESIGGGLAWVFEFLSGIAEFLVELIANIIWGTLKFVWGFICDVWKSFYGKLVIGTAAALYLYFVSTFFH